MTCSEVPGLDAARSPPWTSACHNLPSPASVWPFGSTIPRGAQCDNPQNVARTTSQERSSALPPISRIRSDLELLYAAEPCRELSLLPNYWPRIGVVASASPPTLSSTPHILRGCTNSGPAIITAPNSGGIFRHHTRRDARMRS